MINIRTQKNELEDRKIIVKMNKTTNWFFGKFNKVYLSLPKLTKRKEESQVKSEMRGQREDNTADFTQINRNRILESNLY